MGYESKAIVMQRREISKDCVFAFEVLRFEMSKADDFKDVFKTPIDFKISTLAVDSEGEEIEINEDKYGGICKYAPIKEVIKWLEKKVKTDDYRRFKTLLTMLNALVTDDYADIRDELVVVHYGH